MILIGLMSGGDYQQGGIMRCGTTTAHGLAKCGFGDSLYTAATNLSRVQLAEFLVAWRHELRHELSTNSRGEIGRKQPTLSKAIPEDFPDIDLLFSYVKPITSESMGRESNNLQLTWAKEPDLGKLAGLCEFYFEWGYKESIIKRFRTVMWHSITLRILRRAVLKLDAHAEPSTSTSTSSLPTTPKRKGDKVIQASGTPSKLIAQHFSSLSMATPSKRDVFDSDSENEADTEERLILKIHGTRTHVSTDGMLEYRLEIAPKQLVRMAESGIKGTRVPEGPDEWASEEDEDEDARTGKGKVPIDPETHLRLWMPACMVALVEPQLVEEYENIQAQKGMKKSKTNRVGMREGKTTTSKGKSKAKVDALIEKASPEGKQRPASPTPGTSSFAQIKPASQGKSKAEVDALVEMAKKTSSGRRQRSVSPTPGIFSFTTTSRGKSKAQVDALPEIVKKASPVRKQRPTSPIPGIPRSAQIKTYDKVIEVSSDSDSDSDSSLPSRIALPPLMAARARATTKSIQATTLSRPGKKAVKNNLTHITESEIIDLT
jgi:holliday junction resolvase YEN1